jgi:DNA-binding ferritin-like protein
MRKHPSLTGLNLRANASKAVHAVLNKVIHQADHSHETLAEHAQQIGTSAKHRMRLVAKGFAQEIQNSIMHVRDTSKQMTGQMTSKAKRKIALLASRKLNEIANRIEQKANAIHISATKSASR